MRYFAPAGVYDAGVSYQLEADVKTGGVDKVRFRYFREFSLVSDSVLDGVRKVVLDDDSGGSPSQWMENGGFQGWTNETADRSRCVLTAIAARSKQRSNRSLEIFTPTIAPISRPPMTP